MRDDFLDSHHRTCPICGKEFWSTAQWVYRRGYPDRMRWFCSWKCMRKDEKSRMTISDRINQAIRDGLNDAEIKKLLGVTQRQIDFRRTGKCDK